jgi:hypothetical protein
MTPGSTRHRPSAAEISRMRFIRSTETAMPPWTARIPPDLPLRAPTGMTGTRWRVAMAKIACTSSALSTSTTASGGREGRFDSSRP